MLASRQRGVNALPKFEYRFMKRFYEQFTSKAKEVKLTAAEREDLRERVVAYMEYHPLPASERKEVSEYTRNDATSVVQAKEMHNQARSWTFFKMPYAGSLFGGIAVLLLVAVPLMAERAMPGDILYSVKVGFNEEVRSTIARSPYQTVEWETERINRRLTEIQVLAREGRLTDEHEVKAAEAVRSHSQSARESIEEIRAVDEDEAAMAEIALSALFDVHFAILSAHEKGKENDVKMAIDQTFGSSTDKVDREATTVSERRSQLLELIESSRGDVTAVHGGDRPTYGGLLRRIELETGRAYELLSVVADVADDAALTSITRRLDDIERKVQMARSAHEEGQLMESRIQLAEALTSVRKVITFLTNIEVRNSIDLDVLIPIEYTATELAEQLHFKRERLQVRYEYVVSVLDEHATGTVREQATTSLGLIPTQLASSSQAILTEDFALAGTLLSDIEQALDDIVRLAGIPDRLPGDDLDGLTPTNTDESLEEAIDSSEASTSTNDERDNTESAIDDESPDTTDAIDAEDTENTQSDSPETETNEDTDSDSEAEEVLSGETGG